MNTDNLTPTEIKQRLSQHIGSVRKFKHPSGTLDYTEGIKDMAELCEAYWLIDIVASVQTLDTAAVEEFQVYELTVYDDKNLAYEAYVKVTDGNGSVLYGQQIPTTDFPLKSIKLFYSNPNPVHNDGKYHKGTLYLPSEH